MKKIFGGNKMSEELKITKERIKKLAEGLSSCPEARDAVKDAFPEAFKEKKRWVSIAEKLRAEVYEKIDGFAINLFDGDLNVAFIDGDGIYIRTVSCEHGTYEADITEDAFNILKKT